MGLSALGVRWRQPVPRITIFVALAALIGLLFVIVPVTTAHGAGTLLSQGKPTTASSSEGAGYAASYATDGNTAHPLGQPVHRSAVAAGRPRRHRHGQPGRAQLGGGLRHVLPDPDIGDATNWTTIYSTTTATGGIQTLNISGTGRYVRMNGTVRVGGYGYSLWEFQVYGSTGASPSPSPTPRRHRPAPAAPTNVAQGKPTTASSTEGAGYAALATDGNTATRWASLAADPQWLRRRPRRRADHQQGVAQLGERYATAYQIQISDDNATWTSIYSTTTGTGGIQNLTVTGTGRYVRMYGTVRGHRLRLLALGVQVYGSAGTAVAARRRSPPPASPRAARRRRPATGPPCGATTSPAPRTPRPHRQLDQRHRHRATPGGPANWGTGEVETTTNSTTNVALDGSGHLDLTARNSGGAWTSGRIETQRTDFAAPAGGQLRISASIKQPNPANALGYWPIFRTLGAGYRGNVGAWPGVGESDIMEDVNGRSQMSATLHCGTAPGGNCDEYNGR